MHFPLAYIPSQSYKGGRGFGASREKVRAGLRHGAVDLMSPPGTPVLAIDTGVVTRGPYPFFRGTYAIEIEHSRFIGRYCEIARETEVAVGEQVESGQVIAYVGNQPGHDMLHFEMYDGTSQGDLTQMGRPPYDRRRDLIDPTPCLDRLRHTVANIEGQKKWEYWDDKEGRKFLLAHKKFLIDL
ncbi:MAG TPA: M23 family metallopeptidase [Thermoanaerobaculia bacterium]|jgi:murein DD-endopeptidase MepM/ murein hydrolase activator NlpD